MRTRLGIITLAALALSAAPASAEPAHEGALSAAAPEFAWDGGPGTGAAVFLGLGYLAAGCGAPAGYDCEDTLLKVDDAGELTVSIDAATEQQTIDPEGIYTTPDLDLYLYRSDSAGEFDEENDEVASQADASTDESVTLANATPGFYVARVEFFQAQEEEYAGTAILEVPKVEEPVVEPEVVAPVVAVEPVAPAQPAQPAAPAQPAQPARTTTKSARKKALAKCRKKAKRIKKAKKRKAALKRCAAKAKRR